MGPCGASQRTPINRTSSHLISSLQRSNLVVFRSRRAVPQWLLPFGLGELRAMSFRSSRPISCSNRRALFPVSRADHRTSGLPPEQAILGRPHLVPHRYIVKRKSRDKCKHPKCGADSTLPLERNKVSAGRLGINTHDVLDVFRGEIWRHSFLWRTRHGPPHPNGIFWTPY